MVSKKDTELYLGILLGSMLCMLCLLCIVLMCGSVLTLTTIVLFFGAGDGCPEYETYNDIIFWSMIGFCLYGCCAGCAKAIFIGIMAPEKEDKNFIERVADSFIILPGTYFSIFLGIYAWTIVDWSGSGCGFWWDLVVIGHCILLFVNILIALLSTLNAVIGSFVLCLGLKKK